GGILHRPHPAIVRAGCCADEVFSQRFLQRALSIRREAGHDVRRVRRRRRSDRLPRALRPRRVHRGAEHQGNRDPQGFRCADHGYGRFDALADLTAGPGGQRHRLAGCLVLPASLARGVRLSDNARPGLLRGRRYRGAADCLGDGICEHAAPGPDQPGPCPAVRVGRMLQHYLMMAARGFVRHKLYSFINVAGLAVALACAILILLFVRDQLSYDAWIPGTQNLYRLAVTLHLPGSPSVSAATIPFPVLTAMGEKIPQVAAVVHVVPEKMTVMAGDRQGYETVTVVDPNFFQVLRLPLARGNPQTFWRSPNR